MLDVLEKFFKNARAKQVVAFEFLRLGLKVDSKGNIFAGNIEVAPVKIARALNVDRRVVIETARAIASDEKLLHIFFKLEPRAFIGNAAKEFGFDSIEIRADAKKKGIVAAVTKLLAEEGVVIRQIVTDDPELYPDPVLTIVIDGRLNSKLIKELKELDFAEKVMLK